MEPPRKVVLAYLKAFAVVGAALLVGWFVGSWAQGYWGPMPRLRLVLQFISSAMLIAATLGFLVDVETWKGQTPAEKLNRLLLRSFYALGAFLFGLSVPL